MRKIVCLLVACCTTLLLQSEARGDVGSAVGLRAMLHNCENNALAPDVRINACTIALRSNLADQKMKGFLYSLIAQAHYQASDVDQALKDYEMALESFPNYAPALINHGGLEANAGRFDLALADYDKAILADPANSTALGNRCGVRLALKKDPNEALADCNEALRLEPANVWAHMMRREAYTRLGRCTEAAADFDAAVKIDPSQAKAPADFDAAVRIDPSRAKATADSDAMGKIDPSHAKTPSDSLTCQAVQAAGK